MRMTASWIGSATLRIQACGRDPAPQLASSPRVRRPDHTECAVVLGAVKVWPRKAGACGKVGATANLDGSCARRREQKARRDEETALRSNKESDERRERCVALPKLLDKERPIQGLLGVHSRCGLHTPARSPIRDTHSEGFSHFVSSIAAPVASGWSGCRVGLAPTGKRRLVTAHTRTGHAACVIRSPRRRGRAA